MFTLDFQLTFRQEIYEGGKSGKLTASSVVLCIVLLLYDLPAICFAESPNSYPLHPVQTLSSVEETVLNVLSTSYLEPAILR